ncbi:hypothetical protein Ocin01_14739, partial [Orchesella cincta]
MKFITRNIFILSLSLLVNFCECSSRPSGSSQTPPPLYNIKNVENYSRWCKKSSPEVFFNNVAEPSLTLLYHRGKALFGILMDKIEASYDDSEALEKAREQWEFIFKTVTSSLDSALDRLESEWVHFILLHDTNPLPWEVLYKTTLTHEVLDRLEYGYMMIEAVMRSGVKEVVGSLQHQLVQVIRKLEDEISKTSDSGEDVTELQLLKKMKRGLSKMKPSFTTKLLEKVLAKALKSKDAPSQSNFISSTMDEMALVIHAYREKGSQFPNFWTEISLILSKGKRNTQSEMEEGVSNFIQELLQNQEALIDT